MSVGTGATPQSMNETTPNDRDGVPDDAQGREGEPPACGRPARSAAATSTTSAGTNQ